VADLSDEEFQDIIRKRLWGRNDCGMQKMAGLNELEKYLESGWEYVATLPTRRWW